MSAVLATRILDELRRAYAVSIGECSVVRPDTGQVWRVQAVSADGRERWAAEHDDHYQAVCLLATMMGFDLEN
jgi:hypothetical protein